MSKEKTLTDRERGVLAMSLQQLRPDMDMYNIRIVAKKTGTSWRTVLRYLEGEVGKIHVAKEIILACRKNINDREQKLSNHAA